MKFYLFLFSFLLTFNLKAQEVELVIASGLDWAQCVAISNNNRFVARAILNTTSIWDVKTGRMIRNVPYTDNLLVLADSIWFTEDNTNLVVELMQTNDVFHVNIATGESTLIEGEPVDWTNYKYVYSNQMKSSMHLYSSEKKDLIFPSPDGKKKIIYRKIKNPLGNNNVVPYAFQILIKTSNKSAIIVDTSYAASFVFSKDSRYLFNSSSIFDLETNRKVSDLKIVPYAGKSVMFLPGNHIPVTAGIGNIRIWDFPDIIDIPVPDLVNFKSSLDGRFLICEKFNLSNGFKDFITVDLKKRKIVGKSVRSEKSGYLLDMSANGEQFCFLEMSRPDIDAPEFEYTVKIYDRNTGKLIKSLDDHIRGFFSTDNNLMITDSVGSYNFKYDIKNDLLEPFPKDGVVPGTYIPGVSLDHQYIMGSTYEMIEPGKNANRVNVWDSNTGEKVFETHEEGVSITAYQVSKDHKYLSFASSKGNVIYVFDFQTGKQLHKFEGHSAMVEITYFSDDGKRLISSSIDGTRRIWNIEKGTPMVSLISTGVNDYAIVTPKQYYFATKGAQKLIHFVKGTEIFPFQQFDLKYNRPDIIIESMEASNQDLIVPFNLAYQKRLKRLGFTEDMLNGDFHLPIAQIINEKEIPISTSNSTIKLNIAANDAQFRLDRVIIRVNEVPIHGKGGISLRDKKTNNFNKEIAVELSSGKNNISVSVMNEKGVESIASNISIDYISSNNEKPNLYLFSIGVSKYQQSQYDLSYAAKDAEDIERLFSNDATPFNEVYSTKLTNEQVTVDAILDLKEQLEKTNVNDAVCIFFAGHGLLDVELNYFLASHDIDFNQPNSKGIPYEVFEDLLDDIPARKKLILIDACHSGEIDKDEVVLVENELENEEDLTFRAVTSSSLKRVGLNNSFELMKELFTDIRKSSGTMIISSAGGMEYAMEGADWNNGVFTYCFLDGLKNRKADLNQDGTIMISEMNTYVREAVYNLTNGRQQPTNRAEVIESDWQLW